MSIQAKDSLELSSKAQELLDTIIIKSKISGVCYPCSYRSLLETQNLKENEIPNLILVINWVLRESDPLFRGCKSKDHHQSCSYLIAYWRELFILQKLSEN